MTEITIAGETFNVRLEGDEDKPFWRWRISSAAASRCGSL